MYFKDIAPFIVLITSFICILILKGTKKRDISTIDGVFAVIGSLLGFSITMLNLVYSNNYLITIGPLMTIACLLYLRFRSKFTTEEKNLTLDLDTKTLKLIKILYWICIPAALLTLQYTVPYYRPPIFFIIISIATTMLGLEILGSKSIEGSKIFRIMFKVILISFIIRNSAYYISPYPIGSDPWDHAELINDVLTYGTSNLQNIHPYYSNYPLMHLQASIVSLVGNMSVKESMLIIGIILTLSTLFFYLLVKDITGNIKLALLSTLLLNFSDFHIQWSVQIIAMTFGIAIYALLLYLIMKDEKESPTYTLIFILIFFVIIWTHTVTSFITLISIISLYVGSIIYKKIYQKNLSEKRLYDYRFCILYIVLLLIHWMDPKYPFFEIIINNLIRSLTIEADFLGRETTLSDLDFSNSIINISGFLIYFFFGVIGSLYTLTKQNIDKRKFSLIFMLFILYFVFFVFPAMGMRNIMPNRWPAFIYTGFILFVGTGIIQFTHILRNKNHRIFFMVLILFFSSFLMTTNFSANMDSPIYGQNINRILVWKQSEMTVFEKTSGIYSGPIVTDLQTRGKPFEVYIKNHVSVYKLTEENEIDWEYMNNKLVIWREISLTRPIQVQGYRNPQVLLGNDFKNYLDENFNCVFNTRGARAYV